MLAVQLRSMGIFFVFLMVGCGSLVALDPGAIVGDCPDAEVCDDTETVLAVPEICGDGEDDDLDGFADCADDDCNSQCPEACGDGRDNDGDGKTDCEDADCWGETCTELCDDGNDNDGDGLVDCDDLDCSDPACTEECADLRDNDGDGLTDCLDPDCDGQCRWVTRCFSAWGDRRSGGRSNC
jgi:hypothetical protein